MGKVRKLVHEKIALALPRNGCAFVFEELITRRALYVQRPLWQGGRFMGNWPYVVHFLRPSNQLSLIFFYVRSSSTCVRFGRFDTSTSPGDNCVTEPTDASAELYHCLSVDIIYLTERIFSAYLHHPIFTTKIFWASQGLWIIQFPPRAAKWIAALSWCEATNDGFNRTHNFRAWGSFNRKVFKLNCGKVLRVINILCGSQGAAKWKSGLTVLRLERSNLKSEMRAARDVV